MRPGKLLIDAQNAVRRLGIDVRTYRPVAPRRQQLLAEHSVGLVLDVGAYHGEYVRELRSAGYTGSAVSFEPGRVHFEVLSGVAASDPSWSVYQVALSDETGDAELALAGVFSSLLRPNETLMNVWADARSVETEVVRTTRLDDLSEVVRQASGTILLKLDVQGNEMRVLAGATETLAKVEMVELELTITPLYEKQALMVEVLRYLDDRGFTLVSLDPISRDFRTGHYYQFDGILVRDYTR